MTSAYKHQQRSHRGYSTMQKNIGSMAIGSERKMRARTAAAQRAPIMERIINMFSRKNRKEEGK